MNAIDRLIELLELEHAVYGKLLSALEEENRALMLWHTLDISGLSRDKEELSAKLKVMGEEMREIIGNIAAETGQSVAELTLANIAKTQEDAVARDRLMEAREKLFKLSAKTADANNSNRTLISNAVNITKRCLKYMASVAGGATEETYSGGKLVEGKVRPGLMLTRSY